MEKIKRNERIAVITKTLCDNPGKLFTLSHFCAELGTTKSSLSEDISALKEFFEHHKMGKIETLAGATGGVRYVPYFDSEKTAQFTNELAEALRDSRRALSGGYLYVADILSNPEMLEKIAQCMATPYINKDIDYVLTIETKGIPVALTCARMLGVPLLIARRDNRINEGPQVSINYIVDSGRSMSTMSLPKRAVASGKRVLIVDDFMRAGGSVKGLCDLMKEFNVIVAGVTVVVATQKPQCKLIDKYRSMLTLYSVDDYQGKIDIRPSF